VFKHTSILDTYKISAFKFLSKLILGNKENNKPWFNGECKDKRDELHNGRKKYASSKPSENKTLLNTRAKEYRLVLNANYKKYTEKCSDVLRSLS
jgi:hypothetical protein